MKDFYSRDPLVREIIDNVIHYPRYLPILPEVHILEDALLLEHNLTIPDSLYTLLISNVMSYFHIQYFKRNLHAATEHNIALFDLKPKFFIPQFSLCSLAHLEKMTNHKSEFALSLQQTAHNGSLFQCELILSRIYTCILEFLSNEIGNKGEKELFQHILAIAYFKGKVEFFKKYPTKDIDWSSKESKIRHILPDWRKSGADSPDTFCRFAKDIQFRIQNGFESLTGAAVKIELRDAQQNQDPSKVFPGNTKSSNSYSYSYKNSNPYRGQSSAGIRGGHNSRKSRQMRGHNPSHKHNNNNSNHTNVSNATKRGSMYSNRNHNTHHRGKQTFTNHSSRQRNYFQNNNTSHSNGTQGKTHTQPNQSSNTQVKFQDLG